jgi:hypothetical protein
VGIRADQASMAAVVRAKCLADLAWPLSNAIRVLGCRFTSPRPTQPFRRQTTSKPTPGLASARRAYGQLETGGFGEES